METKTIYVEIELNNTITVKKMQIPTNLMYDVKRDQFIRDYFSELGYEVGNHLKVC